MNRYKVIILGQGLAGLTTAARLTEQGIDDILVVGSGYGGTPYIAAVNFVLPEENPYGDSAALYAKDMLQAGYGIGNEKLVRDMAENSYAGYEFLRRWGVEFATEDGRPKLRHLSGHSIPRSLCQTTGLIGAQMLSKLLKGLKEKNVTFTDRRCVRLLSDGKKIYGATLVNNRYFRQIDNVYAPVMVAAWGGAGRLFGRSTYPGDVSGEVIGKAWQAGAAMVDLEFVEYEPMVVLTPEGALGEPCPTAMLGEGAHLLNAAGERFMLSVRPSGEAGAPKSLINQMIWKQAAAGKGSPLGGAYVDLRHIPRQVLEGYPWFYRRLLQNGVDPKESLIEVGPMAHSHSGGILVDEKYRSTIRGLYAVGEAAGGVHGACRCAGNAASQAVMSGLLCADAIAASGETREKITDWLVCHRRLEYGIYQRYAPVMKKLAAEGLAVYREEKTLQRCLDQVEELLHDKAVWMDEELLDLGWSIKLMLRAALNRRESRGTHLRLDYPETDPAFARQLPLFPAEDEIWRGR